MYTNKPTHGSRSRKMMCGAAVVFMLLLGGGAAAQREVMENAFFSLGAGVNAYPDGQYGLMDQNGIHLEAALGYQLTHSIGLRARVTGMGNTPPEGPKSRHLYASADLMWDITSAFKGYNYYRRASLQALYGFGLAHTDRGDNDFAFCAGLRGEVRAGRWARLFLEVKGQMNSYGFDDKERVTILPQATAGVACVINENGYFNRDKQGMPRPESDWYLGFGLLGANSFQYGGIESFGQRMRQVQPALQLVVGKSVTPYWSGRFSLSGGQAAFRDRVEVPMQPQPAEVDGTFRYVAWNADIMLNASQVVSQRRFMQRFSVNPFLGAGMMLRTDHAEELRMTMSGGLFFRYIINSTSDIFLDARYNLVHSGFAHIEGYPQRRLGVGVASLTAGYIVNIGHGRFRRTF